jgi:DhnA family fructose-bisphosphate aldolase class Ia
MNLGKSLRLRRIFAKGRALIVPLDHRTEDPVPLVRSVARSGVDAVALSPGVLERVIEDLAGLAVILRLNGSKRTPQLVSVQGALELGAEAVLLRVDAHDTRDLERLGRVTEDARRLGMPVIAEILGEDLPAVVTIAAEYGADVIQTQSIGEVTDFRQTVRTAGRPVLASAGLPGSVADLLRFVNNCLEAGGQGVVIEPQREPVLAGINALVHQGVSVAEALAIAESERAMVPE